MYSYHHNKPHIGGLFGGMHFMALIYKLARVQTGDLQLQMPYKLSFKHYPHTHTHTLFSTLFNMEAKPGPSKKMYRKNVKQSLFNRNLSNISK